MRTERTVKQIELLKIINDPHYQRLRAHGEWQFGLNHREAVAAVKRIRALEAARKITEATEKKTCKDDIK